MTEYRNLRNSADGRIFGARCRRGRYSIFSSETLEVLADLRLKVDAEYRVALDSAGCRLFAGWWEGGVSAIKFDDGRCLWKRKDLMGIQRVEFLACGLVIVEVEAPDHLCDEYFTGLLCLSADTGRTIWQRSASRVHADFAQDGVCLRGDFGCLLVLDAGGEQLQSFSCGKFVDICSEKSHLGLAELTDGASVLSRTTGLRLKLNFGVDAVNVVQVSFLKHERADRPGLGDLLIACRNWTRGERIFVFDAVSGVLINEYARNELGETAFIRSGKLFVSKSGAIRNTLDGQQVAELKLPPKLWWTMGWWRNYLGVAYGDWRAPAT